MLGDSGHLRNLGSAQTGPLAHRDRAESSEDVRGSRAVKFVGKTPAWRAEAIAYGLIRTGRAANAQPENGFIRLKAKGGGFYWV
jgi:hypothetical protein